MSDIQRPKIGGTKEACRLLSFFLLNHLSCF